MASRLRRFTFGPTYGGVNLQLAPHVVADNVATRTDNWVVRPNGIQTAKGWEKFTSQVLTDGAASPTNSSVFLIDQFFMNDGSSELIAFTNDRVYKFNEDTDLWIPITPGTKSSTTVDADSGPSYSPATRLHVASTDGYTAGEVIIINEGGVREEEAVIASVSAGAHFDLREALTYDHTAADADAVRRTYAASVSNRNHATTVDDDSVSGQKVLNVASTSGYDVGNYIVIDDGGAKQETGVIDTIQAGVSLTLVDNLANTHLGADAAEVYQGSVAGSTILIAYRDDPFTAGEELIIAKGTSREERAFVDTVGTNELTLTTALSNTHLNSDLDKIYRVAEFGLENELSQVDTDNTQNTYYFTDGVNAVQKWDAGEVYHEPLPGIGSTDDGATYPDVEGLGTITSDVKARYIRSFEGFLVLGYMVEEGEDIPQKIRWSRLDNFESWVNNTDGTGQAGFFTFESSDWIMGLHQLKRELLIYRERSIEAMSYIGEPDIFGFRRAEMGTGLVAPRALVDLGDKHIFVGPDNFWGYNGVSLIAIGDPIKDRFFNEVDPSQLENVMAVFLEERDEVWFTYSTTGNRVHDKAFVYNTVFRKWSGPRDVDGVGYGYYRKTANETWDSMSGTWNDAVGQWNNRQFLDNAPTNMMGNDDGLVFEIDEVATADGSTISKRYETKLTNLGVDGKKRVQRVRIGLEESGSASASVYLGYASSAGDAVSWSDPFTFTPTSNADPYVFFDITAEYFKVRIDTDDAMNIRDIEVYFYPRTFR